MRLRTKLLGGATAIAALATPLAVWASSHREAPFITKSPKVDGTDFYMFNSYDPLRVGTTTAGTTSNQYVTLLANYIPVQDAYGGPNFFSMDPDAIYEISIDNDGDSKEDITFQFQFSSTLANAGAGLALPIGGGAAPPTVALPFATIGSTDSQDGNGLGHAGFTTLQAGTPPSEPGRNILETYTVTEIKGDRRTGTTAPIVHAGTTNAVFAKPVDNIGNNTIANYAAYSQSFMFDVDIPGCTPPAAANGDLHPHPRVFVGQRKEGFAVNLGQIFDTVSMAVGALGSTNANGLANVVGPQDQGPNGAASNAGTFNTFNILSDKNVTTIALEIPASCLTKDSTHPTIGGWTTASVRQARVLNPTPTFSVPSKEGGAWTQVSRLGSPLVNEVVIGLPDKDKFNASEPVNDGANFATYVTNPTLPKVLSIVYGGAGVKEPNFFPRADLVQIFLTGITGVNNNGATSEMLRLNTNFAATPAATQNTFGALGCFDKPGTTTATTATLNPGGHSDCDPAGYPDGRRPGDDVVDIALRSVLGALINTTDAPTGGCIHTTPSNAPNAADNASCLPYGDGVGVSAANFDGTWPYLKASLPGGNTL